MLPLKDPSSGADHAGSDPALSAVWDADADAYDRYLQQGRGRLRQEAALSNLLETVPDLRGGGMRVLDAGAGTGRLAVRLSILGHRVRALDPSPRMLVLAQAHAAAAGPAVEERLTYAAGTIEGLRSQKGPCYDIAVAHHVLEYVPDPVAAVRALAASLRTGGHVSLVTANRLARPLRLASQGKGPGEVRASMEERRFRTELFGGWRTEYTPLELESFSSMAGLVTVALRGVGVFANLQAGPAPAPEDEELWLQVELDAGREREYLGSASYIQCIGRKPM